MKQGTLFIVATPIGNADDWTDRAKSVLQTVDIIAAEDTRVTREALRQISIEPRKIVAHHDHNEQNSTKGLIEELESGKNIALVSDAGTPLINDPGFHIVNEARARGIKTVPVPGSSSIMAALSVAGFGGKTFFFGGFLSSKSVARQKELTNAKSKADTLVFFEAPHRICETLEDAMVVFSAAHSIVICRELTKTHEEILAMSLENAAAHFKRNEPRGEFVLVIKGSASGLSNEEAISLIKKMAKTEKSSQDILHEVLPQTEMTRKQVYDLILKSRPKT